MHELYVYMYVYLRGLENINKYFLVFMNNLKFRNFREYYVLKGFMMQYLEV